MKIRKLSIMSLGAAVLLWAAALSPALLLSGCMDEGNQTKVGENSNTEGSDQRPQEKKTRLANPYSTSGNPSPVQGMDGNANDEEAKNSRSRKNALPSRKSSPLRKGKK